MIVEINAQKGNCAEVGLSRLNTKIEFMVSITKN